MGHKYANILETVGHTPVVKINKLGPPGINLYVKIEAFNPLGSVKDRLALGVVEDAEKKGTLKPGQTVVEATSGNTGIGLAMVCAQKGYPLVVTMAETFSVERRKLMRFLGEELPYSVTVEIEQFVPNERGGYDVHGLILVEREGQKKMVIGNKGSKIKTIGIEARQDMEQMFETKVHLELWVKVKSGWADDERALRSLGYTDDLK